MMKKTNELINKGRMLAEASERLDIGHSTTMELVDHAIKTKDSDSILKAVWNAYYLGLAVGNNA